MNSETASELLSSARPWARASNAEPALGKEKTIRSSSRPASSEQQAEDLFRNYYRRVKGYFLRRGCDEEQARELVQSTFLRASRGLSKLRDRSLEAAWLFTIASNVFRSHIRDQKAEKRAAAEVAMQSMADEGEGLLARQSLATRPDSPLKELLGKERRQALQTAISKLPPQMRACLELRVSQDRKYREIAEILGVSVSTVKTQIFHAKSKLHDHLTRFFDGNES